MAYVKKIHCFDDCGSNMGAGDRSDGHLTEDLKLVTCGTCKRRITEVIAARDWSDKTLPWVVLAALTSALKCFPQARKGVTSKKSGKALKRERGGSKPKSPSKSKVTWTGKKGRVKTVCEACFYDVSLPATDQFGYPRGTDIRKDHNLTYCGTCGEDYNVVKIRV